VSAPGLPLPRVASVCVVSAKCAEWRPLDGTPAAVRLGASSWLCGPALPPAPAAAPATSPDPASPAGTPARRTRTSACLRRSACPAVAPMPQPTPPACPHARPGQAPDSPPALSSRWPPPRPTSQHLPGIRHRKSREFPHAFPDNQHLGVRSPTHCRGPDRGPRTLPAATAGTPSGPRRVPKMPAAISMRW
jgi:hypothetical protein